MVSKPKKYTEKDINDDLQMFKKSKKLRETARRFKIPITTLHDRIKGKYKYNKNFCRTVFYLSNLFKNGEPGYKWYKLFLKRWPELSTRKAGI